MPGTSRFIAHDTAKGVARLLAAARDLPPADTPVHASAGRADAPRHREVFASYVRHLRWAVALAIPWWNDLVHARMSRGEHEAAAIRSSYVLRPAGPASRPEVVWVVRSHWLACADLNGQVAGHQKIRPELLLLEWLRDDGHELELKVVSGMPYWPVGLDASGLYC